mmetsp:Transcript_18878/g.47897  ORF Transcript_18878/g.47897 Transcript_18878/m.47897 type:complete len:203 (-) Transcript_18878:159-767(-)
MEKLWHGFPHWDKWLKQPRLRHTHAPLCLDVPSSQRRGGVPARCHPSTCRPGCPPPRSCACAPLSGWCCCGGRGSRRCRRKSGGAGARAGREAAAAPATLCSVWRSCGRAPAQHGRANAPRLLSAEGAQHRGWVVGTTSRSAFIALGRSGDVQACLQVLAALREQAERCTPISPAHAAAYVRGSHQRVLEGAAEAGCKGLCA